MTVLALNSGVAASIAAAASQEAQLAVITSLFSGNISVRYYSAGDVLRDTVLYAGWVLSATNPRYITPGAYISRTLGTPGTATYAIIAIPGGADVLRVDVTLSGAVAAVYRTNLGSGSGANGIRITAQSSLPVVPELAGTWQALSFPSISRKTLTITGHSATWNPAIAVTVDGITPTSTAVVPYRAFGRAVMGEPGVMYYHGGLHSNYPGNEMDRIDARDLTATAVGNSINHQARVPPQGQFDGYDSGSTAYVYKQYGTALADPAEWQPYTYHGWCFDTYRPGDGFLFYTNYAVGDGTALGANPNGEGSDYQQSSQLTYTTPGDVRARGMVRYYRGSKYEKVADGPEGSVGGMSDYNAFRQSIISVSCNGTSMSVNELVGGSWVSSIASFSMATIMAPGITNGQIVSGKDGNGILVQHLERNKYLVFTTSYYSPGSLGITTTLDAGNYSNLIWVLDLAPIGGGAATMTRVLLNGTLQTLVAAGGYVFDGGVGLAVDRASRTVYALAVDGSVASGMWTGTARVWAAGFDDLSSWTERTTTSAPTISQNFAFDREPLKIYNGHGILLTGPEPNTALRRVRLGTWEVPPSFTFYRHEQATQNFQLAAPVSSDVLRGKHANYAYRSVDGRYYQMGGDIAESFTQSSYALTVGTSSYTFTQELDELTPAPIGYVRPWCTDDGAWAYCGATNTNATLADRFIYFRGGQGISYDSSVYMAGAYASQAAAEADRWTGTLATLYDPVNQRFTAVNFSGWTLTKGTDPLDPRTYDIDYSRNGAWDGSRNQMFRFASGGRLTRWDFDAQTIRVWNVSFTATADGNAYAADTTYNQALTSEFPSYVADATWPNMYINDTGAGRYRTVIAAEWEHQATWLDESNGRLYVVSPFTGYLWCYETRGTERTNGDGTLTIPFYAIQGRIPVSFHWPQKPAVQWDARMHSYLVPFKGGLLWTHDNPGNQDGGGRHAFWRRLGFTGEWTPITLPQDWAANGMQAKTRNDINNDEFIGLRADISVSGRNSQAFYMVR